MIQVNLRRVDLNLLVTLDLLLEERHVTRAADRLALTQSATSGALGRLRSLFNDELLVRAHGGLRLTPLAERIQEPLRALMQETQALLGSSGAFDPGSVNQTLRVGMADYASMVLMPKLVSAMKHKAPMLDLVVLPSPQGGDFKDLDSGRLDLAIAAFGGLPDHLQRKPLLEDTFVCLMRSNHPAACGELTARTFDAYTGIVVAGLDGAFAQAAGQTSPRAMKHLTVPHCSVVPLMLRGTDSIAVVPGRLAANHAPELTTRTPPMAMPVLVYEMVWHPRSTADPARVWLRSEITRIALEA